MLCVCSCRRGSMCRPGQGAVAEGADARRSAEVETRPRVLLRWRVNLRGRRGRVRIGKNMRSRGTMEGDARAKAQQRRKAAHVRVDRQPARGPRPQERTVGTNPFSDKVLKRPIHSLRSNWLKRQRSALFPLALARLSSPAPHSRTRTRLYVCFCVAFVIHRNKMITEYE
jgi:hypothetical protein